MVRDDWALNFIVVRPFLTSSRTGASYWTILPCLNMRSSGRHQYVHMKSRCPALVVTHETIQLQLLEVESIYAMLRLLAI